MRDRAKLGLVPAVQADDRILGGVHHLVCGAEAAHDALRLIVPAPGRKPCVVLPGQMPAKLGLRRIKEARKAGQSLFASQLCGILQRFLYVFHIACAYLYRARLAA